MITARNRGATIAFAFILHTTCVLATNRVNLYGDTICLGGSGFETPNSSDNGQCHKLVNIQGVKPVKHDVDCEITIYSDIYCTDNATVVPFNECGNMTSVGSYSLDCYGPQPVASPSMHSIQTTEKRVALSSKPSSRSSTSTASTLFTSPRKITSPTPPILTSTPIASPTSQTSTFSSSTSPTSTSSSSSSTSSPPLTSIPSTSPTLPLHSIDPYSHIYATSPTSTTTPSPTAQPRNPDRTSLSSAGTIALSVVIPGVGVIVAIVFGVRMWNRGGGGGESGGVEK